jgi:hypothetical protein
MFRNSILFRFGLVDIGQGGYDHIEKGKGGKVMVIVIPGIHDCSVKEVLERCTVVVQ